MWSSSPACSTRCPLARGSLRADDFHGKNNGERYKQLDFDIKTWDIVEESWDVFSLITVLVFLCGSIYRDL